MSRNILKDLYERKAERLAEAKQRVPFEALRASVEARGCQTERSLIAACRQTPRLNIIGEIKSASPSRGMIRAVDSPEGIALQYERAGAAAVSVLTEEDYFHGSLADLTRVRQDIRLPVLRKDFIFDPYQVYESKGAGADALLLIVAMLDSQRLKDLIQLAASIGIESLVEVHDEPEMEKATQAGARMIGVNNRDLVNFQVDLDVSRRLISLAPAVATMISESGLQQRSELLDLRTRGYHAFLIGEHLMRSEDPEAALRQLVEDGAS